MKGDFTRGIQPDRKRGKRYRRVLVQQSRVLLDSDAAALVDAIDHELRQVTSDLGCRLGSPDLGYLITPGRLLALFERIDGVTASGPAAAVRDYQRKYPEEPEGRYPSLRIDGVAAGNSGPAGTATIPLVEPLAGPFSGQLAIWYRADAAVAISVTAGTATTPLALPAAMGWTRGVAAVTVAAGATLRELSITGDPGAPVWIALVELHEDRGAGPHFWAAAGRFHAEGLTPALAAAAGYPGVSYPASAGFPTSESMFALAAPQPSIVAYLETWERDITAAEDPGIREVALGKVDTTVRTEVIGQVKWAVAGALTPAQVRRAFRSISPPASQLVVSAPTAPPSSDPCALPTSGGYTGADHRLYRFEVHFGGAPMDTTIKWSRDNAAHVFAVREIAGNRVTLDRNCGLLPGDIVEVLSDVVDLGDAERAAVVATGVTPTRRRVGLLARLKQEESDSQGRDVFSLLNRTNPAVGVDPAADPVQRYPMLDALRLRRWDGVAAPEASGADVIAKIEDGIELRLAGTFRPGEYWQYEARRGASNDNGPWRAQPHGAERILAPLALLDIVAAPSEPLHLRAWLDDRFSPLCELDADDIEFDGVRIGTDADTVQEAIEELYERDAGNCADVTLGPNGRTGDDTLRIRAAITAITFPPGGHLTLEPGVYDIHSPIVIDKEVVIRGCPEATLLAHGDVPIFEITSQGRLRIEQLILYNGPTGANAINASLVRLYGGGRLAAREVGFLGARDATAIRTPGASPLQPDIDAAVDPVIDPDNLPPREDAPAHIDLQDCVVITRRGVIGEYLASLTAARTAFVFRIGGISVARIDQAFVTECSFRDSLVSSFFDAEQPELIRARTDELLESAAALPPTGQGCAIAVTELLGGRLERNHQRCGFGVWARVGRDLAFRDDDFAHPPPDFARAIRIHHARRIEVEGGRYDARFPIQIPLSARQVTIRRCVINAHAMGITLAGEQQMLVNAGSIVGVLIEGNHVTTNEVGIAIGAFGTQAAEVDDVRIAGNVVRVVVTSSVSSIPVAIAAVGDGSRATEIVIDANDITTDNRGIQISGAGVIRGNQIRLASNGPAIYASGSEQAGRIAVIDNMVVGGNFPFEAIYLSGTPDIRLTGNQVRTTAAQSSALPLALTLHGAATSLSHYIAGNDFDIGFVQIVDTNNLFLIGNKIRYLYVNSGASGQNGVIHGNQLGADGSYSADLYPLRGIWKISDNFAPGEIWIQGSSHEQQIRWRGSLFDAARLGMSRETRRVMVDSVTSTISVAPRATLMMRASSTTARELGDVNTALADIISTVEHELLAPMRDFLLESSVAVNLLAVSDPFDFHFSGNRCSALRAFPATSSGNDPSSTLHAVDNKVTNLLQLEMYSSTGALLKNVFANNSAAAFSVGVATTTTPITTPNLDRVP